MIDRRNSVLHPLRGRGTSKTDSVRCNAERTLVLRAAGGLASLPQDATESLATNRIDQAEQTEQRAKENALARDTQQKYAAELWSSICTLVQALATLTAQRGPSFD